MLDCRISVAIVDWPTVRRLLTIAGVNVTRGAGLVAPIGDIRRFSILQKLVSCFGLNPRVRQSAPGFASMGPGPCTRATAPPRLEHRSPDFSQRVGVVGGLIIKRIMGVVRPRCWGSIATIGMNSGMRWRPALRGRAL